MKMPLVPLVLSLALVGCLERRPANAPVPQLRPIDAAVMMEDAQQNYGPGSGGLNAEINTDRTPPQGAVVNPTSTRLPPTQAAPPPADVPPKVAAAQARVRIVTDKLLAGSPNLGLKPGFFITDQTDWTLQRRDFERVFLSEGLVQACTTEGQLAALVSLQLAEMYAQRRREIDAALAAQNREPPPTVPMVRENGSYGNPDQIHLAEIAKLGLDKRRRQQEAPVDANVVARQVLVQAGYSETDLDHLAPLLKQVQVGPPAK